MKIAKETAHIKSQTVSFPVKELKMMTAVNTDNIGWNLKIDSGTNVKSYFVRHNRMSFWYISHREVKIFDR